MKCIRCKSIKQKRKSVRRKSVRHKSVRHKSVRRKSVRHKSKRIRYNKPDGTRGSKVDANDLVLGKEYDVYSFDDSKIGYGTLELKYEDEGTAEIDLYFQPFKYESEDTTGEGNVRFTNINNFYNHI